MDSAKKDVDTFHEILAPFLKRIDGSEEENILDSLLVHLIKDERTQGKVPMKAITYPVETVDQVIKEVQEAIKANTKLRVAGSLHSAHDAIFPKDEKKNKTLILTGDLRKIDEGKVVEEDGKKYLDCRVGAGCYLGKNPSDIHSTWENSVCYYISQQGYCFPELGGIIHQTVGGFIQTGSAGGSLKHGFADVIREIEFVDGTGKLQIAKPNTDLWCAVGVSMGLFGIITHVTFRLPEAVLFKGSETGYEFVDSPLGPDKTGKSKLKENLETHEYFRVNWFPQEEVNRVQEWSAKQTTDECMIVPYHTVLECPLAAGMAAIVLSSYNCILQNPDTKEWAFKVLGCGLKQFVQIETKPFCDVFYRTLPMDNCAHVDTIIRVDFTEIWMPIDQCQTVMDKLQALFKDNRKAAGNFATEIYAAKESPFWLGMSYGGPMVRVDPYWWAYNKGDLREYFTFFWDVLLEIPGTRLHWGKYLPFPEQKCGSVTFNLEYLKQVFPKMDDWLAKRIEMDPHQIFVTDYWRGILEIPNLPAK